MSIIKKYSYWIHSGKYTAIYKFSTLLIGTVSFMLLARILGPAGYGIWGIFLVISSIVETSRTALVRNAFMRFMHQNEDREEQGNLQAAAIVLSLIISAVLAVIFLCSRYPVIHWFKSPELAEMLQWYAITIILSSLFSNLEMLLNAKMDFKGICWMYCIRQGLLLAIIAYCYLLNIKITSRDLSFFYMGSFIVGMGVGFHFAKPYLILSFKNYKKWIPKLWKFGKYVFGTSTASLLFRSTDNFMAFTYFGSAVSAYYNVCLRISNLVDMPSQVFSDLLFPKAAKFSSTEQGAIKYMYERTVGAILIFSIPALIFVILFPELILLILAGKEFVQIAPILRITAFFGLTLPFLRQFGIIMDATGHPHLNFRVNLIAVLINIVNNIVFIYFFGIMGAALGTALTYFIIFIISQYLLNKKFGISWLNVFKNTIILYSELLTSVKKKKLE